MARARTKPKNLIEKLADAGEEALAKVADAPVVGKVVESATGVKDRLDELTHKVRGLEGIEKRVKELERKVEQLQKASKPAAARPAAARRTTAAAKPTAAPKKTTTAAKKPGRVAKS
jgi:hypothetical protein